MIKFKEFVDKLQTEDRSGRFAWKKSDLETQPPKDRSGRFIWGNNYGEISSATKEKLKEGVEVTKYPFDVTKTEHAEKPHVPSKAAKKSFEDHYKKVTGGKPGATGAINQYKSHSTQINKTLRRSEGKSQAPETKHLDALTSHKTTEPHVVYRAFGGTFKTAQLTPGTILKDHAHISTSFDPEVAKNFHSGHVTSSEKNGETHTHHTKVIAKIHLPVGTKAHHIDGSHHGDNDHEDEVVLHRGTSFKVTHHTTHTTPHPKKPNTWYHEHVVHMTAHHQEE